MKIRKKILVFILGMLTVLTTVTIGTKQAQAKSIYSAAYWGAKKKVTVPKKLRGTWYLKGYNKKPQKFKFTTHKFNNSVIYKDLSEKASIRYLDKYDKLSRRNSKKVFHYLDNNVFSGILFRWHGNTGINLHTWLIGQGGGAQYVPITRKINGKKVKAIRIGGGAGNTLVCYAYHNKSLALTYNRK